VLLLLLVAMVGALIVYGIVAGALNRLVGTRYVVFRSLIERTNGVARCGFILLALSFVLPIAPVDPLMADEIHKLMIAGLILLIGWVALLTFNMAADRYVGRLQLSDANNLLARKAVTQVKMLKVIGGCLIITLAIAFALMTFDSVRQFGISLFASAGIAGLAAGIASRSILANLFAGLQLALTQPIRIDDAIVVENEWGIVEELTSTYVVIRLWDLRRLIVPLSYFIEKPFQNWTRASADLLGSVFVWVDYAFPVDEGRTALKAIIEASHLWDKRFWNLQVTDATDKTMQLRVLATAADSSKSFDLRCEIREKFIAYIQRNHPHGLPRLRTDLLRPSPSDGAALER